MSEISKDKVENLRDIILKRANEKKDEILKGTANEASAWLAAEKEKLEKDKNFVVDTARKRAEDAHRRQMMTAERERSMELLRIQNKVLSSAMAHLQDKLGKLNKRADYADILAGMCIEAVESLGTKQNLELRLSASDSAIAQKIIAAVTAAKQDAHITFDSRPAPITGGCWIATERGDRQVNIDWSSVAHEMTDELAERLLPLL